MAVYRRAKKGPKLYDFLGLAMEAHLGSQSETHQEHFGQPTDPGDSKQEMDALMGQELSLSIQQQQPGNSGAGEHAEDFAAQSPAQLIRKRSAEYTVGQPQGSVHRGTAEQQHEMDTQSAPREIRYGKGPMVIPLDESAPIGDSEKAKTQHKQTSGDTHTQREASSSVYQVSRGSDATMVYTGVPLQNAPPSQQVAAQLLGQQLTAGAEIHRRHLQIATGQPAIASSSSQADIPPVKLGQLMVRSTTANHH